MGQVKKPKFREDEKVIVNNELSIWEALTPVFALVAMLAYNVYVFGEDALEGSNQFILLLGGAIAAIVGFLNKVTYKQMLAEVAENVRSTTGALLILLMVGALSGTWLISGIIPAMIYYGLEILNPTIFLAASVIISAIISIATGSSWTTSATVGIALIGIGGALGISLGMTAGAVLSGAYFGDKMSPLSDTTNLAPAMAGGDLFSHIRYMTFTTVPTISVTLLVFIILGFTVESTTTLGDVDKIQEAIKATMNINGWLFIVPLIVIGLIVKKTPPLAALLIGTLLGAFFALIFQPDLAINIVAADKKLVLGENPYAFILETITREVQISTEVVELTKTKLDLNKLFKAGGMSGMLGTIWLIVCAMVFGGIMDGIGALQRITKSLLGLAKTTFGLFASTVGSCLALNVTASDQYLALVVPGKMFSKAYRERKLAPENLSRTLEDSGTVTSVLVPWNTCGAYHSGVLGVSVGQYALFAIFNWLSPIMTLLFAAFRIKIKMLVNKNQE